MLALTVKNMLANKARVALITLAVVIGVSFVSSTFVFSDSLTRVFSVIANDVSSGIDLEVRPVDEFGTQGALTSATAETVAELDGVRAVGAFRQALDVVPVAPDGEIIDGFSVGLSWITDPEISLFTLTQGSAPDTGDFAMSAVTADAEGFVVGQTYDIVTPAGVVERRLTGLVAFKADTAIEISESFTLLALDDAQQLFGGAPDQIDALAVAVENNASAATIQAVAQSALGDQLEVVSQRTVEQEQQAQFNSQISLLRNVLLGFAVVSLFVSTFIIYNTFGIILSQRIREIGLLRAIGADSGHIGRSVLGEAVLIGLISSVLGLFAGVGLNAGLIALLNSVGAGFPAMDTIIATRTIILAFAIGIGVTLLSALGPARQASKVAPVTAMRGTDVDTDLLGRRVIVGSVVTVAGMLLASFGLFTATGTELVLATVGLGVVAMFGGVTLLSPALVGPVVQIIGLPFARLDGASGSLARGNAARNRRRSANTAAALMIGLSLVTTTLVVGQSVKAHLSDTLDETVTADFIVSNDFDPVTADVATRMGNLNELGAVLTSSEIEVKVGDEVLDAEAITFDKLDELFDIGISSGALPAAGDPGAVVSEGVAADLGVRVGDDLNILFDSGAMRSYVVSAFYTDTTLIESGLLLSRPSVVEATGLSTVDWVAAKTGNGVKVADAQRSLAAAIDDFPQAQLQTSTGYRESIEAEIDQMLSIVNVMLALSIVIALIGIGLTLALSVFERTREIGLLRGVGMSARQVRRMIRWEATLIALFGTVLGVGMGLTFGWGAVMALPDNLVSAVSIPVTRLSVLVLTSAIAGLIAALLPARRAARMNVLDAITGR